MSDHAADQHNCCRAFLESLPDAVRHLEAASDARHHSMAEVMKDVFVGMVEQPPPGVPSSPPPPAHEEQHQPELPPPTQAESGGGGGSGQAARRNREGVLAILRSLAKCPPSRVWLDRVLHSLLDGGSGTDAAAFDLHLARQTLIETLDALPENSADYVVQEARNARATIMLDAAARVLLGSAGTGASKKLTADLRALLEIRNGTGVRVQPSVRRLLNRAGGLVHAIVESVSVGVPVHGNKSASWADVVAVANARDDEIQELLRTALAGGGQSPAPPPPRLGPSSPPTPSGGPPQGGGSCSESDSESDAPDGGEDDDILRCPMPPAKRHRSA